ncbi:MAG: hypothetical protein AB7N80_12980 [Bdellovibrionales bacterium]
MRARLYVLGVSVVVAAGFLGFNNCSEVSFSPTPEYLALQRADFEKSASIEIENNAEFTNQSLVQLKLSSARALEMKISNQADCSDGVWEPFSSSKAWNLSNSNQKVSVYVQYKSIVAEVSSCVSDDIIQDNVPPQAVFQNAAGLVTKDASVNISWIASDNLSGVDSASCVGANDQPAACTSTLNASAALEGQNNISVRLKDKAGNESAPLFYSWLYDKTTPTATINSKPAALTSSTSADLEFSGQDSGSGIAQFLCRMGNADFQECSSVKKYAGLSAGPQKFEVYAVDRAGNRSTEAVATWTIDLTAPTLKFTETPLSTSKVALSKFAFEGIDDGQAISRFECRLDDVNFTACTSPQNFTASEGLHTYEVRGYDSAGNVSEPIQFKWLVDSVKPSISLTATPAKLTNLVAANFSWNANDSGSGIKTVECRLNSAAFAPCGLNGQNLGDVSEGAQSMDAKAIDNAGNESMTSYAWTVDRTLPTVTITSGPAPYVSATSAQFTFSGQDANGIQGYRCRLDAGSFESCASPYDLNSLAPTGHVLFVQSVDRAGNVSLPASYSWNVDKAPPIIQILGAPSLIKRGDPALISYEVTDLASGVESVRCGLTSAGLSMADCPAKAIADLGKNLPAGKYTYEILATDRVGNSITEKVSFEVTASTIICDPFVVGGEMACNGGLVGDIYYLDATKQAKFKELKPKTVDYFYSNGIRVDAVLALKQLFVSTRKFNTGFPSSDGQLIKDNAGNNLFEYFAFRLETVLKLDPTTDLPGWYQFATLADDGTAILTKSSASATTYDTTILKDDGDHSTRMGCSTKAVFIDDTSRIPLLIKYYQGPREQIAMTIMWKRVQAMNSPIDVYCGEEGNEKFFGPEPYQNFTDSLFGQLTSTAGGWRVIGAKNFIAPPR